MALTFTPQAEFGQPILEFSLPSVDGKMISTTTLKAGKPIVIAFICNHCPYVQAIEDRLIQLGKDLKELGIPMVGISSNDEAAYPEDSFPEMQKRSTQKGYSFPYLHDKTQEVAKRFGAICTPDFFVYDSNYQLAYRGRLDDSWKDPSKVTKRELFEATKKLLAGEKLTGGQTAAMGCSIKWKG